MKIFKLPEVLFSAILISSKLYSISLKYQQQNLWKDFSPESSVIILLFEFYYKKNVIRNLGFPYAFTWIQALDYINLKKTVKSSIAMC